MLNESGLFALFKFGILDANRRNSHEYYRNLQWVERTESGQYRKQLHAVLTNLSNDSTISTMKREYIENRPFIDGAY